MDIGWESGKFFSQWNWQFRRMGKAQRAHPTNSINPKVHPALRCSWKHINLGNN